MSFLKRLNARLDGWRLYLVALLFSIPDMLDAVVGFDWASVLPDAYKGYGARIGACLALARLVLIPAMKNLKRAGGTDTPGNGQG